MVSTMTAQCSGPFSVTRSTRMDSSCQEDSLQTRVASSEAVAADIAINKI